MEKLNLIPILTAIIAVCIFTSCKKDDPKPAEVIDISLKTPPTKVDYHVGDTLDLTGLVVTLAMDNGTEEDVAFVDFESKGLSCTPENGTVLTTAVVTITHTATGISTNQVVTLKKVTAISIKTPPIKVGYYVGEVLDLSGLVVSLTLNNGDIENVELANFESRGITCYPVNGAILTTRSIEVAITHTLTGNNVSQVVLKTITDGDNNTYSLAKVGSQIWMAENLKTNKYQNGDDIGTTNPVTLDISLEIAPKNQWAYEGNEVNVETYGRLYTWHAAKDSRSICPTGWHIPSDIEWTTLITYLGGESIALDKLIDLNWSSSASNSSGFSALPSGLRYTDGIFRDIGIQTAWWSSDLANATRAWKWSVIHSSVTKGSSKTFVGLSVRCVKD